MKSLTKFAAIVAFVPVVAVSGSAFAGSPGQLAGGDNYLVKNLTQNGSYSNTITATCNDEIEYSMQLSNTQFGALNNVTLTTTLPSGGGQSTATATTDLGGTSGTSDTVTVNLSSGATQSLDGSAVLYDSSNHVLNAKLGDPTKGVNIGTIAGSTTEFVNFKAQVSCPTPPPAPVYSCDAFNITAEPNRTVKISAFSATAKNGAVFKSAVVDWGDKSAQLTNANIVGQSHQYAADGKYLVTATAHFTVNGQDVTAGGLQCEKQVTFASTTPPQVTPPSTPPATPTPAAPTALVNTGPGSVAELFAATTAAGAVAYRWMLGRRLSRQ